MESNSHSETQEVVVLMENTCASTSGRSTITFQLGCLGDSELQVRISGNTGTGAFSREWVPLRAVGEALKAANAGEITSSHLRPLFAGGSINTPSFLLAALASEGLVRPSRTHKRSFECGSEAEFAAKVDAWRAGIRSPDESGGAAKRGAKRKGPAKKRSRAKVAEAALSQAMHNGADEATQDRAPAATQNGAGEATQNGAPVAAEDGAALAMQAIPPFTDLEPAKSAVKPVPPGSKKKRAR